MIYPPLKILGLLAVSSVGKFCLVRTNKEGVLRDWRANCQAATVSLASAGRKTLTFGIALKLISCSMG